MCCDQRDPRSDADMQLQHAADVAWSKTRPAHLHANWRNEPSTERQRAFITSYNLLPPIARGDAADLIKEIIRDNPKPKPVLPSKPRQRAVWLRYYR